MPQNYAKICTALLDSRNEMLPIWDFLARTIMPRKRDLLHKIRQPSFTASHSATAESSLLTLVGAFLAHVTPSGQPWMEYTSRSGKNTNKLWYKTASEIALRELAASNFYAAIHEHDLETALFGTAATLCEEDPESVLRFVTVPLGSFGIAENHKGEVDKFCREFEFSADQIATRWPNADLPAEVLNALNSPENRHSQKFTIRHLVLPRSSYTLPNGGNNSAPHLMPFASIYMLANNSNSILEEGGYQEFPFFVSRFLRWTDVWGYAPGLGVVDELRREIKLDRNLDELSDLSVYPRIFIDAEQDGDLDFRPGSCTVIDRNIAGLNLPREWGTNGRYDIGIDRLSRTSEKIKQAFYTPFLHVISSQERQMSATEVVARQSEQVIGISSAFSRYVADLEKLQIRIFSILFRSGAFADIPGDFPSSDLVQKTQDGTQFALRLPGIQYHGRIVQAIQQAQKQSLDYGIQSAANYIQVSGDSSAMDCIDISKVVEFIFHSLGAPTEIFRTPAEIKQLREQRKQQQQAQLQLTQAEALAKAAQVK